MIGRVTKQKRTNQYLVENESEPNESERRGLRGMSHRSDAEEKLLSSAMRRFSFFCVVCLGFYLPVSLFENETLLFDPGPPALGTHSFTRIDHCGGGRYEEDGGGFKQICISF